MAIKTKDALKTQSTTTFFDNDLGGIVPLEHRTFNTDLIDSMATSAQGAKADTAIQAVTVGGSAIPKSGTTLQFPAYATAAQGTKADNAIQTATVGGASVPKSGATLQFPAYPKVPNIIEPTKAVVPFSTNNSIYWHVIGNLLVVAGSFTPTTGSSNLEITNIPTEIMTRIIPTPGIIAQISSSTSILFFNMLAEYNSNYLRINRFAGTTVMPLVSGKVNSISMVILLNP